MPSAPNLHLVVARHLKLPYIENGNIYAQPRLSADDLKSFHKWYLCYAICLQEVISEQIQLCSLEKLLGLHEDRLLRYTSMYFCVSENDCVLVCIRNLQNLITLRMDFICNEKASLLSSAELFCPTQTWFPSLERAELALLQNLISENYKILPLSLRVQWQPNNTFQSTEARSLSPLGPRVSSFLPNMSGPPESSYKVTIISQRRIHGVCYRLFSHIKCNSTPLPALADEIPHCIRDLWSDYNLDSYI